MVLLGYCPPLAIFLKGEIIFFYQMYWRLKNPDNLGK